MKILKNEALCNKLPLTPKLRRTGWRSIKAKANKFLLSLIVLSAFFNLHAFSEIPVGKSNYNRISKWASRNKNIPEAVRKKCRNTLHTRNVPKEAKKRK